MPNKLNDIELRSEEVQEILTAIPHWMIRWGNVVFLSIILLLFAISWMIKYPDIIVSEAVITTEIPPQKEFANSTGKIDTIFVINNENVSKDQRLAIIENTANFEDVFYLDSILDTLEVNSESFKFPIENLPVLFLGEIESEFAMFENSYLQYQLNKRYKPYSSQENANKFNLSELKRNLITLKSQKNLNASELEFTKKKLNRNEVLFEKGVISAAEYEKIQLEYLEAERNYKNINVSISQLKQSINDTHKTAEDIVMNKNKEDMVLFKNVIQSFNQLKKSIEDWKRKYMLKSSIEGKVSFLNFWNENQSVNQGDLVFTIIPIKSSSFIAKLKTPIQNSGKIEKGQTVFLKLENYPESEFGTLKGKISNISLIPNQEGYYYIDVSLPNRLITSYKKHIEFKQEMRGVAEIVTEDLRLTERLFYQFRSIISQG